MNKYVYMRHVSTVLISSDFELLIHSTLEKVKKDGAALRNWLIKEADGYSVTFRHFPVCMKCDSRAACSSAFLLAPRPMSLYLGFRQAKCGR